MSEAREYKIEWGYSSEALMIGVNNMLRLHSGWEPVGGVAIVMGKDGKPEKFLQAMVRK